LKPSQEISGAPRTRGTRAREVCAEGLKEMARLAIEAESESVRTSAFARLFKVAYGKELSDTNEPQKVVQIVRWAQTDEEATPDPMYDGREQCR
jgi:hypothetical protein